jgi:hypothetical protein
MFSVSGLEIASGWTGTTLIGRSSVCTVVFLLLSIHSTISVQSTVSRRCRTKDQCVICYGVTPMIDVVGV